MALHARDIRVHASGPRRGGQHIPHSDPIEPEPGVLSMLIFLTNIMTLPAMTVCDLYRLRWQVELLIDR